MAYHTAQRVEISLSWALIGTGTQLGPQRQGGGLVNGEFSAQGCVFEKSLPCSDFDLIDQMLAPGN